ncbi:MAG: hypothetical protein D6798_07610 [Deltaproteobacteria bacterium]|nr:MAG: hypothetical protein D6798_07610 [Deltaproteobacteria bacterium]
MNWLLGGSLGAGGHLVWTSPTWVIATAAATAVLAWLAALWTSRKATRRGLRAAGLACEGLALAVLAAALAGPSWVQEEGRREPGRLVVLVDGSASMGVREGGRPRSEAVGPLLERLQAEGADVYTFDEDLRSGPPDGWTGRGTDLGVALDAIADRFLGQRLRGLVLITDGLDRGSLRRELTAALDAGRSPQGIVPDLPGPLTVYAVGRPEALEDTAVDDVITGGFAFLRTPFTMTAQIRGPAGATLPVTLTREGSFVSKRDVHLDADGRGEVVFEVNPREVGRFAYEVFVPVADSDAVPGNNRFPVVVRVVRDRIRVLQVSGSPSYDTKFLRLFLKEDQSVDLVSFFILRTTEDMGAGWRSDELSLIAFPYERLFSEDIDSFDLVIFQNFDYKPYFDFYADVLLQNIADYVRKGGALVMTGGDRSFDLGAYAGTPVGDILPVTLGVTGPRVDEAPFQPVLTRSGRAHPVTRLGATAEETDAIWARLPELDGVNRVVGLAPDSAALLEHPTLRGRDGPAPVLAVREVGKGRTMALMVDASWRWSFSEAAAGRGNQAYLRFWKNALRWLMADPEDQRVVVSPARENVLLGDDVRVVVRVLDAGYLPTEGAKVDVEVTAPDGRTQEMSLETDAAGEVGFELTPEEQGAWRVRAKSPGVPGAGETVFAVSARDPELVEIVPDHRFLRQLVAAVAAREGGAAEFRLPGDRSPPLLDDDAGREVLDRRETRLADIPLVGLLVGGLASLGWALRRRAGAR